MNTPLCRRSGSKLGDQRLKGDDPAPKASLIMLQYPDLFYVPPALRPLVKQQAGIAVRKGDTDILNYLDNWLLQRRRDGWLEARWHCWSETTAWFDRVENNPYVLS